jgi:hypothetical protein
MFKFLLLALLFVGAFADNMFDEKFPAGVETEKDRTLGNHFLVVFSMF